MNDHWDVPDFAELYRTSKIMREMNKKISLIEVLLNKLSQLQNVRQKKILVEKIHDEYLNVVRLKSLLDNATVQYAAIF